MGDPVEILRLERAVSSSLIALLDAPDLILQATDTLRGANLRADGTVSNRFDRGVLLRLFVGSLVSRVPGRARFFVAMAGHTVVGVGGYKRSWASAGGWELAYGAVHPDWQGRGVGMALLRARLDAITAEGRPDDFVFVRSRRPGTFLQLGFRCAYHLDSTILLGTVSRVLADSSAAKEMSHVA